MGDDLFGYGSKEDLSGLFLAVVFEGDIFSGYGCCGTFSGDFLIWVGISFVGDFSGDFLSFSGEVLKDEVLVRRFTTSSVLLVLDPTLLSELLLREFLSKLLLLVSFISLLVNPKISLTLSS